jgi:hypothetical protein
MKWSNQSFKLSMAQSIAHLMKNKRRYPRKFCSESSFFATRYGVHECFIKNLGSKGAFIETDLFLPEGNIVTIALPAHGTAQTERQSRMGGSIWFWRRIWRIHPNLNSIIKTIRI